MTDVDRAYADGVLPMPIEHVTDEQLREALNFLTPEELARFRQLARESEQIRNGKLRPKLGLRRFVDRISGQKFKWYKYAITLAGVLQRVADGELTRVMIFAPPRHGKSELVSRLFPAYYLYRYPERWVGLASYAATLATKLSKAARANYFAYHEQPETGAVKEWETGGGGGMWSTGVGGGFLGKGFHLGLIDDPLANAEQANSPKIRDGHKEWWKSTFSSRAEPNAAIVIIQQRWHEDDLCGFLLEEEWRESQLADDALPERWHIVFFEALKSSDDEIKAEELATGRPMFPPTCSIEPDWRKTGEALCEERYPRERLLRTKRRVGAYFWGALYQQRPRPREGLLFQVDKLRIVEAHDVAWERLVIVRYWDKAGTESDSADFTVGSLVAYDSVGDFSIVLDIVRGQWEPAERDRKIEQTTQADVARFGLERYTVWGEREPASAGKDAARQFRTLVKIAVPDVRVFTEQATGAKTTRADPLASDMNNDQVRMLRGAWNAVLRREFLDFPNGINDDIVDATSGAFNKAARRRSAPTEIAPSVSRRTG